MIKFLSFTVQVNHLNLKTFQFRKSEANCFFKKGMFKILVYTLIDLWNMTTTQLILVFYVKS